MRRSRPALPALHERALWAVLPGAVPPRGRSGARDAAEAAPVSQSMRPATSRPCRGGRLENGSGKRYARCSRCRRIDWEGNDGDRCRELASRETSPREG